MIPFSTLCHFVHLPIFLHCKKKQEEEGKYIPFHSLKFGFYLLNSTEFEKPYFLPINKKFVSAYSINKLIRFLTYYDFRGYRTTGLFTFSRLHRHVHTKIIMRFEIVKDLNRRYNHRHFDFPYQHRSYSQRYTR